MQQPDTAATYGHDRRVATPRTVHIVAAGTALLGTTNIVRIIARAADPEWPSSARTGFLLASAIPFTISAILLPLAYRLHRGRPRTRTTAIALVAVTTLINASSLYTALGKSDSPLLWLTMSGLSLGVLLGLTVPRPLRAYFATNQST